MSAKTRDIFYDKESDILEVSIGKPSDSYFDEVEDDLFEAHDMKTDELKGYKIFNFLKRGGMKNIRIPFPSKIDFP